VKREGRSPVAATVAGAAAIGSATAGVGMLGALGALGALAFLTFVAFVAFVVRFVVANRVVLARFVVDRVLDVAFFTAIVLPRGLGTP
jgi:hypothetical protein